MRQGIVFVGSELSPLFLRKEILFRVLCFVCFSSPKLTLAPNRGDLRISADDLAESEMRLRWKCADYFFLLKMTK